MKIGEARNIYSKQISIFRDRKSELEKERNELKKKIKNTPNGYEIYEDEAAKLELSYNRVSDKYDEYRQFMSQLMEMHMNYQNLESTKQQGEWIKDYAEDEMKIMEVARRIANGDKVPAEDERRLMEYNMELYMTSKNLAMLKEEKERKEYDSLWDENEEEKVYPDAAEVADNMEVTLEMPDISDVGDL